MGIKILKCNNCGAKLEGNDAEIMFCPHCGARYVNNEEKVIVTNNNYVVKNFYGSAAKTEEQKDKIAIYKSRLYDNLFDGNVSEARDYCVRVLNREPENESILFIKKYIEKNLKGENGRYKKVYLEDSLSLLNSALDNNINFDDEFYYYLNMVIQRSLYFKYDGGDKSYYLEKYNKLCLQIYGKITYLTNDKLKETFTLFYNDIIERYNKALINEENQRKERIKEEKISIALKFVKWIVIIFAIIAISYGIAYISSYKRNEQSNKEYVTVTYYSGSEGYLAIYSDTIDSILFDKYTTYECEIEYGGRSTAIVAIPMEGYEFYSWSDGFEKQVRQEVNIKKSISVTAYFRLIDNNSENGE